MTIFLPRKITVSKDWLTSYGTKVVLFFFIPKNILYFRTEQNAHVKWGWGGGDGRDSFFHCIFL